MASVFLNTKNDKLALVKIKVCIANLRMLRT